MQQLAAIPSASVLRLALLACAGLFLAGCRKEEARSYSVPKEGPPSAVATMPTGLPQASGENGGVVPVSWTAPAGWQEQPAGGMRVASFGITKDGQKADVSIIPLGGGSGGELANVNRWRGQVGLEPLDQPKLTASAEKVSIGNQSAALYDLAGTDPQTKQPTRILGAMLPAGGTTWFFKMTGSDALVAAQKPAFKEFLQSVKLQGGPSPSALASAPGALPDMAHAQLEGPGNGEKPTLEAPADWKEQTPSSMRVASYRVTGEAGAKADISVVKLAGTAGGNLANVNRWRSQLGLEPIDQAGLDKLVTTHEAGGTQVLMVDMAGRNVESGEAARLLAAIVPRSGTTWFYKMVGDDQLVERQKAAFTKFVDSARYPNG